MKPTDFANHLTEFLSVYLPSQKNVSKNTIYSYRDTFKLLLKYCRDIQTIPVERITVSLLTSDLITGFLQWLATERGCCISTRNQRLAAIHSFFHYLQGEEPSGLYHFQKVMSIPIKKASKTTVAHLTPDAIILLLEQPDKHTLRGRRDLTLLSVLYDTGARVQELIDIRGEDVILDSPSVVILHGKGNKNPSFKSFHNHAGFAQVLAEAFDQVGRYPDQAGGYTGKHWSTGFSNYFGGGAFGR